MTFYFSNGEKLYGRLYAVHDDALVVYRGNATGPAISDDTENMVLLPLSEVKSVAHDEDSERGGKLTWRGPLAGAVGEYFFAPRAEYNTVYNQGDDLAQLRDLAIKQVHVASTETIDEIELLEIVKN